MTAQMVMGWNSLMWEGEAFPETRFVKTLAKVISHTLSLEVHVSPQEIWNSDWFKSIAVLILGLLGRKVLVPWLRKIPENTDARRIELTYDRLDSATKAAYEERDRSQVRADRMEKELEQSAKVHLEEILRLNQEILRYKMLVRDLLNESCSRVECAERLIQIRQKTLEP